MSNQSADANRVIDHLVQQIAELSRENAIMSTLAKQLQEQLNEANTEKTIDK